MSDEKLLFRGASFAQLLQGQREKARALVEQIGEDTILTGDRDALAVSISGELFGTIPILDEANITTQSGEASSTREDYGRRYVQHENYLTVFVPFAGDSNAFYIQPSQMTLVSGRASVSANEVRFTVSLTGRTKEQVESEVDGYVRYLKEHLDRLRTELGPFNDQLLNVIKQFIAARYQRLQERQSVAGSLKYKSRQ